MWRRSALALKRSGSSGEASTAKRLSRSVLTGLLPAGAAQGLCVRALPVCSRPHAVTRHLCLLLQAA